MKTDLGMFFKLLAEKMLTSAPEGGNLKATVSGRNFTVAPLPEQLKEPGAQDKFIVTMLDTMLKQWEMLKQKGTVKPNHKTEKLLKLLRMYGAVKMRRENVRLLSGTNTSEHNA